MFLDLDPERGIVAGERWERALNDAARRCEAVLFLISKAWLRPAPRPAAPARIKCLLPSRTLRLGPQPFGGSWRTPEIDSPPWGELAAVDLSTNQVIWRRSLGTTRDRAPLGLPLPLGVPTLGGPVATKGGLVFIAGTIDNYLRAFSIFTGKELWRGRLPGGGQATPMTYISERSGRQFVVIAAGGHSGIATTRGDSVVAFTLPKPT